MIVQRRATISPREQAERYLAAAAPAIQGQGGNSHTCRLAKAVVMGFDLDPHTAFDAFRRWNETCQPPWKEPELRRIMETAHKWPGTRGKMLHKGADEPFIPPPPRPAPAPAPVTPRPGPVVEGFRAPTLPELRAILYARDLGGLAGLSWAAARGALVVGQWRDWWCYGVTDSSARVLEIRRADNEPFPEMGPLPQRKSHSLKGSEKQWPLGIQDAVDFPAIALVEGVPDFLVAHECIISEQATPAVARFKVDGDALPDISRALATVNCAPVAMLSASPAICADALPFFKGKHVRIFAHAERAGLKGAEKWRVQIAAIASRVDIVDFSRDVRQDGTWPNDLDEWSRGGPFGEFRVMPT